jgi:hypothetical protein
VRHRGRLVVHEVQGDWAVEVDDGRDVHRWFVGLIREFGLTIGERGHDHGVPARGVPPQGHPGRVDPEVVGMGDEPAHRRQGVRDLSREMGDGCGTVLRNGDDEAAAGERDQRFEIAAEGLLAPP